MPPQEPGRSEATSYALRLFRVAPDTSYHLRTLSHAYGGVLTHYTKGGSVWCNPEGCLSPFHKKGPIWKGYCTCELYDEANRWWAPVVFEMSEACELDFRGRYRRGQIWIVERAPLVDHKKPPVRARLIGEAAEDELPPAHDYVPVLRSVYHAFNLTAGVKNPLPARVIVQPTTGAPPPDMIEERTAEAPATETFAELMRRNQAMNGDRFKPVNGTH